MSCPTAFADVDIDACEETSSLPRPEPDRPFRIVILGDFSARESRGLFDPRLTGRRPLLVDRDNFDQVMAKLGIELQLPLGGAGRMAIRFAALEDFHPDRILGRLTSFQALREMRRRLADRSTFAEAAAALGVITRTAPEPRAAGATAVRALDEWSLMLREIVAPYLEPKPDPRQPELVAQVDAAIGGHMRAVLHCPEFQALEAAWRAVFFLARRLETGTELKLFLLDLSQAELEADLGWTEELRATALYRLLVAPSLGESNCQPWAVLAGNYRFDQTEGSVALLGRMAKLARAARAPFLAAASPRLLGCDSLAEAPHPRRWQAEGDAEDGGWWEALRRLPDASWIGLALPRFLLRLPYGKETNAVEAFDFEEMPGRPRHEDYLWANPAFACVCLLGQAFSEYGWKFHPGVIRDIEGLPVHIYRADGESQLKPCAEAPLTDWAAEAILDRGIMPLLSMKDADTVRLARFQSIAQPAAPLSGRWA